MTQIIRPNAGHILLPRRFVDVGMPSSKVGASGRYQLIKRDEHGNEIERTPWFDNIILDSGLNRWGTDVIIAGAAIGTGTATPVAGDTGLQTQTHYTTTAGTGNDAITAGTASNYNNTRTFVYRTTLGALNGNYSEVGVGWASGSMFSRALILDGGGSPTTVSVSSVQQLDIVYQLSIYPPIVDTSTTPTISGTSYTVTGRAANVTDTTDYWRVRAAEAIGAATGLTSYHQVYTGTLGAITAAPSGTSALGPSPVTADAYSNNSNQRTVAITYALGQGNIGGIKSSVVTWSMARFQYEFNNTIPKDGTKTLVMNYSINWARR